MESKFKGVVVVVTGRRATAAITMCITDLENCNLSMVVCLSHFQAMAKALLKMMLT